MMCCLLVDSVDKRTVLVRAGDKGYFCYLVFSGSVFVNIQRADELTGIEQYKTKDILREGSLFGVGVILQKQEMHACIASKQSHNTFGAVHYCMLISCSMK